MSDTLYSFLLSAAYIPEEIPNFLILLTLYIFRKESLKQLKISFKERQKHYAFYIILKITKSRVLTTMAIVQTDPWPVKLTSQNSNI